MRQAGHHAAKTKAVQWIQDTHCGAAENSSPLRRQSDRECQCSDKHVKHSFSEEIIFVFVMK